MTMFLGGKDMKTPALVTGPQDLDLSGCPDGEVHGIEIEFSGKGISTGAAFNWVGTASKSDDLDKLLAAIFNSITHRIDDSRKPIEAVKVEKLRKMLKYTAARDWETSGIAVDGQSVPVSSGSAAAFGFVMYLPIAPSKAVIADADEFTVGSDLYKLGVLTLNVASLTPTVVLTNGSMVVSDLSIVAVRPAVDPQGAKTYAGPMLRYVYRPGLASDDPPLESAARLFMLDDDPTYTGTYTMDKPVKVAQVEVDGFQRQFRREYGASVEDSPELSAVPLIFPRAGLTFAQLDITPRQPQIRNDGGNTQDLLDIQIVPASAAPLRTASAKTAGPVSTVAKPPPTHAGAPIAPALRGLVGRAVAPGDLTREIPGAVVHPNSAAIK